MPIKDFNPTSPAVEGCLLRRTKGYLQTVQRKVWWFPLAHRVGEIMQAGLPLVSGAEAINDYIE
jgi:hypothetical protein